MMKKTPFVLCIALACVVPALSSSTREDDVRRLENAAEVIQAIQGMPDKPGDLLRHAGCIAVIPGEKKVAFFVGGNYGKGLVTCRDQHGWSAPLFLTVAGGSFGFQWGATSTDYVMIFRSKDGLEKQLSDKFQIGAAAEGAAGPVGREAGAGVDPTIRAQVLTYSRSKGAFAGVDLKGAVLQPDDTGNMSMYGSRVTGINVLTGEVPPPPAARPLLRVVSNVAGGAPPRKEL